jgi:hypothetical protein
VLEETARWAAFMGWLDGDLGEDLRKRYPPDQDWVRP